MSLLILSFNAFSSDEEGTGGHPSTSSDKKSTYKLVCVKAKGNGVGLEKICTVVVVQSDEEGTGGYTSGG